MSLGQMLAVHCCETLLLESSHIDNIRVGFGDKFPEVISQPEQQRQNLHLSLKSACKG